MSWLASQGLTEELGAIADLQTINALLTAPKTNQSQIAPESSCGSSYCRTVYGLLRTSAGLEDGLLTRRNRLHWARHSRDTPRSVQRNAWVVRGTRRSRRWRADLHMGVPTHGKLPWSRGVALHLSGTVQ